MVSVSPSETTSQILVVSAGKIRPFALIPVSGSCPATEPLLKVREPSTSRLIATNASSSEACPGSATATVS